ncbi:MAG: hypothetical protein HYY41_06370 [Chloroflexi bacterium]|nr:hypothetical protein [Chloroflexota bacterium]
MNGFILNGFTVNGLIVRCYSGHTYAQRPQSFQWQGIDYEVAAIEKEWLEPGERHFRVRTGDNKLFQLCYNEKSKQWSLTTPVGVRDERNSENTGK